MKILQNCKHCNNEYIAETRELKRGNGIYCSRKCSGEAQTAKALLEKLSKGPNEKCAVCSTGIFVDARRRRKSKSGLFFCNRAHQNIGYKDMNIAVAPGPKTDPNKPLSRTGKKGGLQCLKCPNYLSGETNVLCNSCFKAERIEKWLSGDISVTWISTTREPKDFVKKYLLETRGDRCEECGFDRKRPDGTSKIQMDHIDGDYTNNEITNLKLLCPNCHDDTETYGAKNKNGGRRYRLAQFSKH